MVKKMVSVVLIIALALSISSVAFGAYGNGLTSPPSYTEYRAKAQALTLEVAKEGLVLLRNEGNILPLSQDGKGNSYVNVFGIKAYSSANMATIFNQFLSSTSVNDSTANRIVFNAALGTAYNSWSSTYSTYRAAMTYTGGTVAGSNADLALSSRSSNEWNLKKTMYAANGNVSSAPMTQAVLDQAKAFSDTALVVLQRNAGEGGDLMLGEQRFSENEIGMMDVVTNNFENVIVVFLTPNYMDGAVLDGGSYTFYRTGSGGTVHSRNRGVLSVTGAAGTYYDHPDGAHEYTVKPVKGVILSPVQDSTNLNVAMAETLRGTNNPSGRLNDTLAKDFFRDPVSRGVGEFELYDYNPNFTNNYSGLMAYQNGDKGPSSFYDQGYFYLVYGEGYYLGYRFYETFDPAGIMFPFGYGLSYTTFDWTVGSATKFYDEFGELNFRIPVTVKNTGAVAGKDVVELYYTQPYYANSVYEVEKSIVNLGAFQKTNVLQPGQSQTVNLEWSARSMASYSDVAENYLLESGTYYFEIAHSASDAREIYYEVGNRAGDYSSYRRTWTMSPQEFTATTNSVKYTSINIANLLELDCSGEFYACNQSFKDGVDKYLVDGAGTLHILADEVTGTKYKNLFTGDVYGDGTYEYDAKGIGELTNGYLHRVDSSNGSKLATPTVISYTNFPTAPSSANPPLIDYELRGIKNAYDFENISTKLLEKLETEGEMPRASVSYYKNGVQENFMLSDVYKYTFNEDSADYQNIASINAALGTSFTAYNDSVEQYIWDHYLDQFNIYELMTLFYTSGFTGVGYLQYGMMGSTNADGPESIGGTNLISRTTFKPTLLAASWNVDLAYRYGEAIAGESVSDTAGKAATTFWYAPGLDTHRGPLGGRNNQYYSEDPCLAGLVCSAQIQGCQSMGVVCVVKHYGLNDAEFNREGVLTFCSEQGIRQIGLKAWERCFKDGCGALMTSLGRVGIHQACQNYSLTEAILRGEWGFKGHSITDGYGVTKYMYPAVCLIRGDVGLLLMSTASNVSNLLDYNDLYLFYLQYPKAISNALRKYAQEYCRNKMESGTFWYYYSNYTYQNYLATANASNRWGYTDHGTPMWYKSKIAVGYEYYEGDYQYTGVTNSTARSGIIKKNFGLKYVLSDVGYKKGEKVSIPVSIADSESLSDFGFSVLFPTDKFALNGISFNGSILGDGVGSVSIGNEPASGKVGGYDYTLTKTARGVDVRFINTDGSNFEKVGGRLFNVEVTVTSADAGDYGISIMKLNGVPFLGTSKQVFTSDYRVGLTTDEFVLEQWEGDSYPSLGADDWDKVGGYVPSATNSITLVASHIKVQDYNAVSGISGPFSYGNASKLSYTISLGKENVGVNQFVVNAKFDAGKLANPKADVLIPGGQMLYDDFDPVTGEYTAWFMMLANGETFKADAQTPILKVTFDVVGGGADITGALTSVMVKEVVSGNEVQTIYCALNPAQAVTQYLTYDLNGDGEINMDDLSLIVYNYFMVDQNDPRWEEAKKTDTNNDGIIDLIDIMRIASYIKI